MRIDRAPLRMVFAAEEAAVVRGLLKELDAVLGDDGPEAADDPVRQRLFPSAYPDDGDAEAEYRSLTESTLRTERVGRVATCIGELADGGRVDLDDPDAARRWLQVLNDLRLALGTRLGVTEEPPEIDPADPQAQPWLLYGWLTELQDVLVQAVMRG